MSSFKKFLGEDSAPKYRDQYDLIKAFREEAIKLSIKDSKAKKRPYYDEESKEHGEDEVTDEMLEDEAMTFISEVAEEIGATTYAEIRKVIKDQK